MALTVPAPVHDLDVHDLDRQSYHQDDDGWEDFPLFPRDGKTDLAPNKNDDAVDDSDDDDRPGVLGEFPPVGSNDLPSTSSDAFRKVSRLSDQSHSLFFRNINDKVTVQYPNQSPKSSLVRSATQEKEQTPAQTNSKRVSDRLSENNAKKLRRSLHSKSTLLVSSQYVIDEKIDKEVGETKKKTDTDQRGKHTLRCLLYLNVNYLKIAFQYYLTDRFTFGEITPISESRVRTNSASNFIHSPQQNSPANIDSRASVCAVFGYNKPTYGSFWA